jgi:methionyl aminopeptidase
MSEEENKQNREEMDRKKRSYFETEPIPAPIREKMEECRRRHLLVPEDTLIKRPSQIEGIRRAGVVNTGVLDAVAAAIHDGMTTQEIDDLVVAYTHSHGGICAPYHFEGYPKSVCTSINEEVCHGIPARHRHLRDGDIVNVDCTTIVDGYYADASRMFMIGEVSPARRRLVEETKKCLEIGMAAAKPWGQVGDIGAAIHKYARQQGFSVVRDLGGHGVGIDFHEDPFVAHDARAHTGMVLVPGMVITIEPMINAGKAAVVIDPYNGWTIYTADHSDSAQWEHTLLITETGCEILSY